MKKATLSGLLACLLVMGFLATGCDNPAGGETDTWTDLTSLDQVNGTWKGSYSQAMTIREAFEEQGETWSDEMALMFGDIRVTTSVEMTFTIDAGAGTRTGTMKITQKYSGGNISIVWPMISSGSSEMEGVTVDDANHSITMTQDLGTNPITISDMAGAQINQNGTKVKVPADNGLPEIILQKQ
jgi:hypothetical protein